MKRINLLPVVASAKVSWKGPGSWTASTFWLAALVGMLVTFAALGVWQNKQISDGKAAISQAKQALVRAKQEKENRQQKRVVLSVDKEHLEKEVKLMSARLALLKKLRAGALRPAPIMAALAEIMPPNIWINKLMFKNNLLTFTGTSFDHAEVVDLMARLSEARYFTGVGLGYMKETSINERTAINFELTAQVTTDRIRE